MQFIRLSVALLCLCSTFSLAQKPEAVDRLRRAQLVNVLDDAALKPWHLKLSFQLFDTKGKPSEQGAIEEWWQSPTVHKTAYSSPSYSGVEIQTNDGLYFSKGASAVPYLLEYTLKQIVHPMPQQQDIDESKPELRKEGSGKISVDCIMLSKAMKRSAFASTGVFPTYCFEPGQDLLLIVSNFGLQETLRNKIGVFQARQAPIEQLTNIAGVNAISSHIEALTIMQPSATDFVPTPDFELVPTKPVKAAGKVVTVRKTSGDNPIYPARAKENHVEGTVTIAAIIGRDGRIHSMKLIDVPDQDLAISSLNAARTWTYTPYLENGVPTEVETVITMNFKFGN